MEWAKVLYALVLGTVQGITEFLPISSSAHLIVVSNLFQDHSLSLALNVALHCGTLLAVLAYFYRDWLILALRVKNRVFGGAKSFESDILFPALIFGSVPAGVVGILFNEDIEHYLHNPWFVATPLAVFGVLIWWGDKKCSQNKTLTQLTFKDAMFVGVMQTLALIPGVSRSGSTILAARMKGYGRVDAAKFSFMLGTPAMLGATLLKADEILPSIGEVEFYLGFLSSFVVGALTIRYFLKMLRSQGLGVFAIYRALLAAVILIVIYSV
jgi:undecaprenyl-diphosphatase